MTQPWAIPRAWEGETVAVLAPGPGGAEAAASARGRYKTIAVNRAIGFAPWADLFVALDPEHHVQANGFAGLRVCGVPTDQVDALYAGMFYETVQIGPGHFIEIRNNLLAALRIAARLGAARIKVYGVDCARYEAIHNFPGLSAGFAAIREELRQQGVIVSGGPRTPLILHAMFGLGDNLHVRGLMDDLRERFDIWINTRWPGVFWDMPDVHTTGLPPPGARVMTIGYHPRDVTATGGVLGAMARAAFTLPGDFRFPVPDAWRARARALVGPGRLLLYRPLIGIAPLADDSAVAKLARNPDQDSYAAVLAAIRDGYRVVSVARTGPDEWLIGPQPDVDVVFNSGELDFETLCGLFAEAALVYCHPGFAAVMAQAVSVPSICVFGGYEDRKSFAPGAAYAPWLPLEPPTPCPCWAADCACDKRLDLPAAVAAAQAFVARL